jgi:hypothetical protein
MHKASTKFADLNGLVDALRLSCPKCGRIAQFHLERLIYEFGPAETVTGWAAKTTADCPRRQQRDLRDPCAMRVLDLPTTPATKRGTGLVSAA